jgi:sugar diacid utilization regulator
MGAQEDTMSELIEHIQREAALNHEIKRLQIKLERYRKTRTTNVLLKEELHQLKKRLRECKDVNMNQRVTIHQLNERLAFHLAERKLP